MLVSSSSLSVVKRPAVLPPPESGLRYGDPVFLQTAPIQLHGSATFRAGEPRQAGGLGPVLGFAQVGWLQNQWSTYAGQQPDEGSTLYSEDSPPNYVRRVYSDASRDGDLFVTPLSTANPRGAASGPGAGAPLPGATNRFRPAAGGLSGEVAFADYPRNAFRSVRTNERTGRANLLREVEWQMLFCTCLLLLDERGSHLYLKHVTWALSYRASVTWTGSNEFDQAFALQPVPGNCFARVDGPFDGPPANSQFRATLDTPTPDCLNTATRKANTERAQSAADLSLAASPPEPPPFGGLP